MTADTEVAAGVAAGARLLAAGRAVVVVDQADALAELLAARDRDAPGRIAVLVGDPSDPVAMDAARQLAEQVFRSKS